MGKDTVIACEGIWMVAMAQRVDDHIWGATLTRHRNGLRGRWRRCSSYESDRAGAEQWGQVPGLIARGRGQAWQYQTAIRQNRLLRQVLEPPFGWRRSRPASMRFNPPLFSARDL